MLLKLVYLIGEVGTQITSLKLLKALLGLADLEFADQVRIKSFILADLLLVALKHTEILLKLVLLSLSGLERLSFDLGFLQSSDKILVVKQSFIFSG